jgi:hypothetical protein
MKLYGKHTHEVAERIVDAFRNPERLPKALAPVFIRRNDDVPCRRWSWHNQLIVALSGSIDARGIKQWNHAGRKVRKGASALWILAPCTKRIKDRDERGEEVARQIVYGFRAIPVFAVEDTEGEPLPEQDDEASAFLDQLPLLNVAKAWEINIDAYSHRGSDPLGYYSYAGNGSKAIMLGVENLSTWCHELVHAADHRLTNLKGTKCHKEVVAELGSAVLLECLGKPHDADLGGAYDYIRSYADRENKPVVKACIEVLDRVCHCVALILDTANKPVASPEKVVEAVS